MDFSFEKNTLLKPKKELKLSTFLIALLSATLIFLPYMFLSKGYFIFFGDFNVQQIPFYKMCHKMIKTGNTAWNYYTDLGANFIGSYSFYLLGSPFFWLTIPFPNSFVPYLMGPLLILKFACAAFTAYLYIRRFTRTPEAARLGALLYAFSGFSVYNIFFNHFHEAIICFPLLLLALELLITENKRGVFALTVTLCTLVNYYFFFGMVVFSAIYFFVRLFSGAIRPKFSRFLILLLEAVLGVMMASVLLIPSVLALSGNSRLTDILLGWNAITYGKEQIYLNVLQCFFFPPDLPARPVFFPGAEVKWSSLGGWLPLFGMTAVFTLFTEKKGSWLKRVIGICIFMALVPILNSSFSAFNVSYYARWFYMPILMMCLATAMLTEEKSVDFSSGFRWYFGVMLAFALVIGLFPQNNSEGEIIFGLYTIGDDLTYVARFWVAVLISFVSAVLLYVLLKVRKSDMKTFFKASTALVCVISVIYANVFVACGRSHSYDIKNTMIDSLIEGEVFLDDNSEFRIDTYDCLDNTGMYLELPSVNAFHSIVPVSVTEFYKFLDVERSVASRPETNLPAIRPLLSVKYMLNRIDGDKFTDKNGKTRMSGYSYFKSSGGYDIHINDNYIPYGFSYDYYMTEGYIKDYTGDLKSRMMLKAVLLDKKQISKYKDCLKNIETVDIYGKDGISLLLDNATMSEDAKRLAKTSAISFKTDKYGFSAKVIREKRSLVFFSVPYDKGWSATVNGEKAEIEKVNKGFMAVAVPKGTSTIRFVYETPGLKIGVYTALGAFLLFLIYYLSSLLYFKSHPSNTEYPEGKELLDKWYGYDIADSIGNSDIFEENEFGGGLPDSDLMEKAKNEFETQDRDINGGFSVNPKMFDD